MRQLRSEMKLKSFTNSISYFFAGKWEENELFSSLWKTYILYYILSYLHSVHVFQTQRIYDV